MDQDGLRVNWPDGLDATVARAVLSARRKALERGRNTNQPAPTNILPCTGASGTPRGCAVVHPPGVYPSEVSPDGATRLIHTRRISMEVTTCTVQSYASSSSSDFVEIAGAPFLPASPTQILDGSFPIETLVERPTLLSPIREASIELGQCPTAALLGPSE